MYGDKSKSRKRERETATSIVDALAREGCALVPGGGLGYNAVKALVNHGRKYFSNRNEQKLENFHKALLEGDINPDEFQKFISKEFSENDYFSLLAFLMHEEELDKTTYYAALMRSIINSKVSNEYKPYYIKTLRELSASDLKTLQLIYITINNQFKDSGNCLEQLKNILETNDLLIKISLANLTRLALLEQTNKGLLPTQLLEDFSQLIFAENELEPVAIGRQVVHDIDVFVATFVGDDTPEDVSLSMIVQRTDDEKNHYKSVLTKIENVLSKLNVNYLIANPNKFSLAQRSAAIIILCLDHVENPMLVYSWDKELLRSDNTIKILMDRLSTTGQPYDTLPGTQSIETFDFTQTSDPDLNKLAELIKDVVLTKSGA